jgi:hypothetical protein
MQTIDVYSFNKLVIENNYEVFEQDQMISYINSIRKSVNDDLFKSLSDELKQKANDEYKSELESFKPYLVVERKKVGHDEKIVKSIKFVRDQQVIWDVDKETNEIMKAKAGTYTNTSLNRKLMRVGAKYGEGKKEETKKEVSPEIESLSDYINRIGVDNLPKPKYDIGDIVLIDMGDGSKEKLTISKISYLKAPKSNFSYIYKTKEYSKTDPEMVHLESDLIKKEETKPETKRTDKTKELNSKLEIKKIDNLKFPSDAKDTEGYQKTGKAFYIDGLGYLAFKGEKVYTPAGGESALEEVMKDGGFTDYDSMEFIKPLDTKPEPTKEDKPVENKTEIIVYKTENGGYIKVYQNNKEIEQIPYTKKEINQIDKEVASLEDKYFDEDGEVTVEYK